MKDKNLQKTKSNKETLSVLEPLKEDRPKYDNSSTFARTPNNHDTRIAERPDQNILGNDEDMVNESIEVTMNFMNMGETYNINITVVDDIFTFTTALIISNDNLDPKPKSIAECWKPSEWVR